jgi:threonine synthase
MPMAAMNPASLQSNQSNSNVISQLATSVSLRCVECAALYPGVGDRPRYRCDCGGVLDVEAAFHHPMQQEPSLQAGFEALMASESDVKPLAGAHWRQLFD